MWLVCWVPIALKTNSFAVLVLMTGKVFEPVELQALIPNLANLEVLIIIKLKNENIPMTEYPN